MEDAKFEQIWYTSTKETYEEAEAAMEEFVKQNYGTDYYIVVSKKCIMNMYKNRYFLIEYKTNPDYFKHLLISCKDKEKEESQGKETSWYEKFLIMTKLAEENSKKSESS